MENCQDKDDCQTPMWCRGKDKCQKQVESDKAIGPLDAAACSPPLGEDGEAYYCKRDDFTRYLEEVVNPARIDANLAPLDKRTAEECYRILNDFARKWGCKPISENAGGMARELAALDSDNSNDING